MYVLGLFNEIKFWDINKRFTYDPTDKLETSKGDLLSDKDIYRKLSKK